MGRQTSEDVLEVREGIDIVVLAGAGQGVEDRCRPAAAVAAQESPELLTPQKRPAGCNNR
jgi:hypothetical protein